MLRGNQDVSLLPTWIGFTNYSSYSISLNDDQIPLILMSQSFTNLAVNFDLFFSYLIVKMFNFFLDSSKWIHITWK